MLELRHEHLYDSRPSCPGAIAGERVAVEAAVWRGDPVDGSPTSAGERLTQSGYLTAGASPLAGSSGMVSAHEGRTPFLCIARGCRMGKLADRYAWADKVARSCTPMKKKADPEVWVHVRNDFAEIACRYLDESRYIPEAIDRPQKSFEMPIYQIYASYICALGRGLRIGANFTGGSLQRAVRS